MSFPNVYPIETFGHRFIGNPRKSMRYYYVYILASKRNGTLYIGVTSNIKKRIFEHKNNLIDGFTKKYSVHNLVFCEESKDIRSAIAREKQIKKYQ